MKVIIYGAYAAGKYVAERLADQVEIVGFSDSDASKCSNNFYGYPVFQIDELENLTFDKIIIAAKSYIAIQEALKQAGLERFLYTDPCLSLKQCDAQDEALSKALNLVTIDEYFKRFAHTGSNDGGHFSFGRNWHHYVQHALDNEIIEGHKKDISWWVDPHMIRDKKVIDIGCGSGLSALCLSQLGCRDLVAFDFDEFSVKASQKLFSEKNRDCSNTEILQGSVLDDEFIASLGKFDLVHSWGVLHHTGDMQKAISNAALLCIEGGYIMIALYEFGPKYEQHLALKKQYNSASETEKLEMLCVYLKERNFRYQHELEATNERGMNPLHDAIDWLGGYPYEVANYRNVIEDFQADGFELRKFKYRPEGANSIFVFQRTVKL